MPCFWAQLLLPCSTLFPGLGLEAEILPNKPCAVFFCLTFSTSSQVPARCWLGRPNQSAGCPELHATGNECAASMSTVSLLPLAAVHSGLHLFAVCSVVYCSDTCTTSPSTSGHHKVKLLHGQTWKRSPLSTPSTHSTGQSLQFIPVSYISFHSLCIFMSAVCQSPHMNKVLSTSPPPTHTHTVSPSLAVGGSLFQQHTAETIHTERDIQVHALLTGNQTLHVQPLLLQACLLLGFRFQPSRLHPDNKLHQTTSWGSPTDCPLQKSGTPLSPIS